MINKAHNLKLTYVEIHVIVLSMIYKIIWFLTVISYLNKINDFRKYLHLMWFKKWIKNLSQLNVSLKENSENRVNNVNDVNYAEFVFKLLNSDDIKNQYVDIIVNLNLLFIHLLNSQWFYFLLYKENISIHDIWKIVLIMTQIIFLKCNFNFMTIYMKNDKKMRYLIDFKISHHRVCIVELKFSLIT